MLELKNITYGYDRRAVLSDLSLTLQPGLLYALIGPNGSGKSTLLSCAGGWKKPWSGQVLLDQADLMAQSAMKKAALSGRLDTRSAKSCLSVLRYVLLGRYHLRSWPVFYDPEDQAFAQDALQAMGIESLAARSMNTLSSGQQQKAAIAQLLCQNPRLFLFDEPGSSLDPAARFELMEQLRALRNPQRIILAVLHDLDLALRYADQIILLQKGQVVFEGSPAELIVSGQIERVFSLTVRDFDLLTGSGRIFPLVQEQKF